MDLYESVIINLLFILFPLLLYLFYIAYNRNLGKEENDLFLDVALLTSLYFTLRYGFEPISLIFNIPLLVAYLKKRYLVILASSVIISYYYIGHGVNLIFVCFEYFTYFAIYFLFQKKKWSLRYFVCFFLIAKMVCYFFCFPTTSFLKSSIFCFLFLITTFFVLSLFHKGEDILKFYMNVKELEQEKQIRMSLFKITHEIKNPIAVCKGYLDMFDVNNVEQARKYVPIMKEEIDRTLILLQDFLSMTKIKIEKDILDINLLLEEVMEQYYPILKERQIELTMNLYDDEIDILGDYNRLTQVFINLLKNSIEALENCSNGFLLIQTKLKKKDVEITIQDNGCGISKEVLMKMKEPFYTTKVHGTGLGVSLSCEIIKAHDGMIEYHSQEGEGTTVCILLPLLDE